MTNISTQINMSQYAREQMIQNLNVKMGKLTQDNETCKTQIKETCKTQEPQFTYDEYIEYCKEHAVMPNVDCGKTVVEKSPYTETIKPIHVGEAIESYSHAENRTIESVFEMEA